MDWRTVFAAFLTRSWDSATGGLGMLVKAAWLKIWRSLGRAQLVKGLSGVSSVQINRTATVRLKCPNPECGKTSDFSIERLKGNPKCLLCNQVFDGNPYVQNLNDQLLAVVQRI